MAAPSMLDLNRWLILGEWRSHPLRVLVAIAAISLGVALGFAIALINNAAYNEFSAAVHSVAGQADLQVSSRHGLLDDQLYPAISQLNGVAFSNPVLELEVNIGAEKKPIQLLGIDLFRAATVTPDLIGKSDDGDPRALLADDAIFLSQATLETLHLTSDREVVVHTAEQDLRMHVVGVLEHARPGQRIAVVDIANAQAKFNRLGKISRVDVTLARGVDRQTFKQKLTEILGPGIVVSEPQEQETRSANLSRAYRVNLNILALVALFTGAFLVLSGQSLSVIRRRQQFAFLRVLGLDRRQLMVQLLIEGGLLGIVGSLLGLAAGYGLAALILNVFGADLGGGYFPGVKPKLGFASAEAAGFCALGVAVALIGSALPAWEAARAKPALALKSGSEEHAMFALGNPWPALACLVSGGLASLLPPVAELPVFGYLAVALLLVGGIALMPRLAHIIFAILTRCVPTRSPVLSLAIARLTNAPGQASIALGGVLSSFSLMVAMAIMVMSFRVSVDEWLGKLLAADFYVRVAKGSDADELSKREQQTLRSLAGVDHVDFLRTTALTLDSTRPEIVLLARPIEILHPERALPLVDSYVAPKRIPSDRYPIWVSEAMVDLYHWAPGQTVELPLGGIIHPCFVAGVWRDYVRQSGAIQMRLEDYRQVTGDQRVNDAAVWLKRGTDLDAAITAIQSKPFAKRLAISRPGDIRKISLTLFDRSFAVTYLLEVVAIVIGLFGVAATFSAQTLARAKEFGMLRHIGVSKSQILGQLALEGGFITACGILVGFTLGVCISLILVFVVNPQSFHWTMQLHLPWAMLSTVAGILMVASLLTALFAGRYAISGSAVRAVREDW